MEQRRVGEYAVEGCVGQIECEEILLPDFAAGIRPRHFSEARGAIEADRNVPERGKGSEVPSRPTAEIQDPERRRRLDLPKQRGDVLAHVMVARVVAEAFRRAGCSAPASRKRFRSVRPVWSPSQEESRFRVPSVYGLPTRYCCKSRTLSRT